jgi:hypothetical protein
MDRQPFDSWQDRAYYLDTYPDPDANPILKVKTSVEVLTCRLTPVSHLPSVLQWL